MFDDEETSTVSFREQVSWLHLGEMTPSCKTVKMHLCLTDVGCSDLQSLSVHRDRVGPLHLSSPRLTGSGVLPQSGLPFLKPEVKGSEDP